MESILTVRGEKIGEALKNGSDITDLKKGIQRDMASSPSSMPPEYQDLARDIQNNPEKLPEMLQWIGKFFARIAIALNFNTDYWSNFLE